jgi:phosphohistidine swiveling domain-containing protein
MSAKRLPEPMVFAGKAATLEHLAPVLKNALVLPQRRFGVRYWQQDRVSILADLVAWAGRGRVVVRSSAAVEDRNGCSMAGHFTSVVDVTADTLGDAIDRVVDSFGANPAPDDEFFVQPMLDAAISGVAFTRDPNTGAPYLVINYEEDGDTAAVTGGGAAALKTYVYWKGAKVACAPPFDQVAALCAELEDLFLSGSLDIEFAFDRDGLLHLFQVRPLAVGQLGRVDIESHRPLLEAISDRIVRASQPHPYLPGQRTLFGIMPDWNPAEIIGVRPKPLALSLYRELVTDSVWAYQRHNYGYRNLRSFPLILSFHGLPYVDVRVSFNSFVPADIPDALAGRLVDCYVDQLAAMPTLHDKVEFEIVHSCYTFDLQSRLERYTRFGFSDADLEQLRESLRSLTNGILHRETGLWRKDAAKIRTLEGRQATIRDTDMDPIARIYWLMEDCKRYGTLPFAGLARAGFIAVQMLQSLIATGALEADQYETFMNSLETISRRMTRDLHRLDRDSFLAAYGHLRPGTYDILCPRYDENPERYLGESNNRDSSGEKAFESFGLSVSQMRRIDEQLREHALETDVVGLFDFIQTGIEEREYAKFVFTRSLSDVLSLLVALGAQHGFDREDMSHFNAADIKDLYTETGDVAAKLRFGIERGRASYAETRRINLPPLIRSPDDVWAFEMPPNEPNFVTQGTAVGAVRSADDHPESLTNAIVVVPSADPGFDWLFAKGLAGLVTAYGGVNSHMAIRAGELGLPAAIGVGENMYQKIRKAARLRLDCGARRIDFLP